MASLSVCRYFRFFWGKLSPCSPNSQESSCCSLWVLMSQRAPLNPALQLNLFEQRLLSFQGLVTFLCSRFCDNMSSDNSSLIVSISIFGKTQWLLLNLSESTLCHLYFLPWHLYTCPCGLIFHFFAYASGMTQLPFNISMRYFIFTPRTFGFFCWLATLPLSECRFHYESRFTEKIWTDFFSLPKVKVSGFS